MLPAPEAHLGHLWHEVYLERGLCRGRVQGSAEQHVPRAWGGVGGGQSAEFAQVVEDEEEEAELARGGGWPPGIRHSQLAPEPQYWR